MTRPGTRKPLQRLTKWTKNAFVALGIGIASLSYAAGAPVYLQQMIGQARLGGEGDYRWFGIKLYVARLWVSEEGYRPEMQEAAPFALELRYARSLDGNRIAKASIDEIRKLGRGTSDQHGVWLKAMQRLFPDVEEGDRITGIFRPGQGARFFMNEAPLGVIDDPEFSRAFFAIWLAENTSARSLREALLRHAEPAR